MISQAASAIFEVEDETELLRAALEKLDHILVVLFLQQNSHSARLM
jgi:hypothetical protein